MTKEEKLVKLLNNLIETSRACKKSFAKSEDYDWAEHYRIRADVLSEVLNYIQDEKHLDNTLSIFEEK